MSMESDLRALMLADAGIAAKVGTRISWSVRPQGTPLPAIVMHLIRSPVSYHTQGPGGPQQTRVQIDCQAPGSFLAAKDIGDEVHDVLSGYAGTFGGTQFQGIFADGAQDLTDTAAAEVPVFVYSLDFLAHHNPKE